MKKEGNSQLISRRNFFKSGTAVIAGSALPFAAAKNIFAQEKFESKEIIKKYRTLGRTGFQVSDISMGGTSKEPTVVRYAYDKGVNYFDTAESYGNGKSETNIGLAMEFMDRKKIFITTKMDIKEEDTKETVLDRFKKCQERLQTKYVDALYLHGIDDTKWIDNQPFHSAVKELKAEGKLRFAGISSHGPQENTDDQMQRVLCAAAEDGRFDLMLLVYNFMNKEAGEKILAACKKNNVGTTAMKTAPGVIKAETFNPDNLTAEQQEWFDRNLKRGGKNEDLIKRYQNRIKDQEEAQVKSKPFIEKYGIKTEDILKATSIKWVLSNPDMHTVCASMPDFDVIDKAIPLSGTKLTMSDKRFLQEYKTAFNKHYCRHGCNDCQEKCPSGMPVSTIMRYAHYYELQGREKYAIEKYANLRGKNGSLCKECDANCSGACPHKFDIQANLVRVHSMLIIA